MNELTTIISYFFFSWYVSIMELIGDYAAASNSTTATTASTAKTNHINDDSSQTTNIQIEIKSRIWIMLVKINITLCLFLQS